MCRCSGADIGLPMLATPRAGAAPWDVVRVRVRVGVRVRARGRGGVRVRVRVRIRGRVRGWGEHLGDHLLVPPQLLLRRRRALLLVVDVVVLGDVRRADLRLRLLTAGAEVRLSRVRVRAEGRG